MESKATIRRKLLSKRDALSRPCYQRFNTSLSANIAAFLKEKYNGLPIATYSAFRGECEVWLSLLPLIKADFYIPRIESFRDKVMNFYKVSDKKQCRKNKLGIWEPDPELLDTSNQLQNPAVFLVPGVGFDRSGRRLGYGGGFYDSYFTRHPEQISLKLGVGFSLQIIPKENAIPQDEFDTVMDGLISEEGVYLVGQ